MSTNLDPMSQSAKPRRLSKRIEAVEPSIIPTVAAMVRDNLGCRSLGQGASSLMDELGL